MRTAGLVLLMGQWALMAQPLPLSLERAIEMAMSREGNTRIQLSAEALRQAESRSAQSRAALLPDIEGAFADQSRTVNLSAQGLSTSTFHVPVPGFSLPSLVGPFTIVDARLSATQTVLDFSSVRRFQASKSGVSAARADADVTDEQVATQVARAYLAALKADTDREAIQANVTLSEALLKQAENLKAAGTGTGIEITRARVQLANDRQRLLVTENARRAAYLQLLRAMNLGLDTELQLTDRLDYVPMDAAALEEAEAQALRQRPDLRAQQERESTARLSYSATKMERLPSVMAFGDYGDNGSALDNTLPTRTVGIQLKVPIFDGGRRDARRAEAASQYRAEKVRTSDLRDQIQLDVRLALDSLKSADEQVKVAKEGLALAEDELMQARRRVDAGVAIAIEVTDAQTRLERARDNQTDALYSYNVARLSLAQAMGKTRSILQ
jgi:outer membrane protein